MSGRENRRSGIRVTRFERSNSQGKKHRKEYEDNRKRPPVVFHGGSSLPGIRTAEERWKANSHGSSRY
jgi:hypothetical protein